MSGATSPDLETLKSKLRRTWEAGDYGQVAKHIEGPSEEFIERLDIKPGERVLDVACGTGNLAVTGARKGAAVTGVDIAKNLIAAAVRRAEAEGLNIRFDEGDAEDLPYGNEGFDTVVSMFGAMFAPRPERVASELMRVTKPGGRIAMANWTPEGFAGSMLKIAAKYLPPPDMPKPTEWGVEDIVRGRFGDSVSELTCTKRMARMEYEFPPADVVEFFRRYFGPVKTAFEALESENRSSDDYRRDLVDVWTRHNESKDGTTVVQGEYLEVIAVKK